MPRFTQAMSRGRVVVDEDILVLAPFLRDLNIRVAVPLSGMTDEYIAQHLASKSILITSNPNDFYYFAIENEIGVIGVAQSFISSPATAAKKISEAIIKFSLWRRPPPYIVTISRSSSKIEDLRGM